MCNLVVNTVHADGPTPSSAAPSAGKAKAKFWSRLMALEGLMTFNVLPNMTQAST